MAQLTGSYNAYDVGDTEIRTTTQKAPLGAVAVDGLGNEYRYIKAGGVIPVNAACRLTGSALGWDNVVVTSAVNQPVAGINGATAFALNEFGWIMRHGVVSALTTGALAANVSLTSAAAGVLGAATAADLGDASGLVLVNSASPQLIIVTGI